MSRSRACSKRATAGHQFYDWLDDLTEDVVWAHPSKVRAIAEAKIKTDKIDSQILAHLLRADLIPKAYAPSKETRALKRVLRQRLFLVQLSTMVKNRIRALLSLHEVHPPQVIDLFGKVGLAWLETVELPQPDGALLHEDRELLVFLKARVTSTDKLIQELANNDQALKNTCSMRACKHGLLNIRPSVCTAFASPSFR